jgi:hypothetical protein
MFELIGRWESGNISQKEFCRQNQVSHGCIQYRRKKFRKSHQGDDFISVGTPVQNRGVIEIIYPNGVLGQRAQAESKSRPTGWLFIRISFRFRQYSTTLKQ